MMGMCREGDTLLGKYTVERILGRGGMGVVVAGRHMELGELHAIKMLYPHMVDNEDSTSRFLREARAAARLKSEHVPRVYDIVREPDGSLYMVMEHLDGTDLKTHLAKHGRLSPSEAAAYVLEACEAIEEAHERGIVHRDIKPANLFLARQVKKDKPIVKVLDFGISKELHGPAPKDLTTTGAILGSPAYMSPEQVEHARDVDARTDIWSLGVVLYELLSGKVPFEGETMLQVVNRVVSLQPRPIQSLVPDISDALAGVIERCMQKNRELRYPSVRALSDALRNALTDEAMAPGSPADTVKELQPETNAIESTVRQPIAVTEKLADPIADAGIADTVAAAPPIERTEPLASVTLASPVAQESSKTPLAAKEKPARRSAGIVLGALALGAIVAFLVVAAYSSSNTALVQPAQVSKPLVTAEMHDVQNAPTATAAKMPEPTTPAQQSVEPPAAPQAIATPTSKTKTQAVSSQPSMTTPAPRTTSSGISAQWRKGPL